MSDETCVLIIEDDRNIVDLLRANLTVRGFRVVVSTDGSDAVALAERERPDMALVDLTLPVLEGFELCRQLRAQSAMGIIVISARGQEGDKVRALNLGADDYLTKPFGIEELLARIHATLRRARPAPVSGVSKIVKFADVVVDFEASSVTKAGVSLRLTATEFSLLREFVENPGKLLSHNHLLRQVWGPGYATEVEYTRVYVRRLRSKLEAPGDEHLIVTEPRRGYRFVAVIAPTDM